jgi:hypothetical protein
VIIDKNSLKGFSYTDTNGAKRTFRRQLYTGYLKNDCYFEVLSEGKISLLSLRKAELESCDPVYNKLGLTFQKAYVYYLYAPEKGYLQLKISRNSLFTVLDNNSQRTVKKLLRKNSIEIIDENSFLQAWNLINELEIKINF